MLALISNRLSIDFLVLIVRAVNSPLFIRHLVWVLLALACAKIPLVWWPAVCLPNCPLAIVPFYSLFFSYLAKPFIYKPLIFFIIKLVLCFFLCPLGVGRLALTFFFILNFLLWKTVPRHCGMFTYTRTMFVGLNANCQMVIDCLLVNTPDYN